MDTTDAPLVVFVAIVLTVVAAWGRGLVAAALGDDTGRRAGRLHAVHRLVDRTGTVLVPALLALVAGGAIAWAAPVPVRDRELSRPRRAAIALTAPATAALVAVAGLLIGGDPGVVVASVAGACLVAWLLPVPPWHGGALVAALLPAADEGRWDRWRRQPITGWGMGVAALGVATGALDAVHDLAVTLAG